MRLWIERWTWKKDYPNSVVKNWKRFVATVVYLGVVSENNIKMNKNEKRRKNYAEMDPVKKEALLKRRRDAYANKKGNRQTIQRDSCAPSSVRHQGLPDDLQGNLSSMDTLSNMNHNVSSSGVEHQIAAVHLNTGREGSVFPQLFVSQMSHIPHLLTTVNRSRRRQFHRKDTRFQKAYIDRRMYAFKDSMVFQNENEVSEELELQKNFINHYCLPAVSNCSYCEAYRFYAEPPCFCCCEGEICLALTEMPSDLIELYTGNEEDCVEFRKLVRTYNNNLAFTTFSARVDSDLLRNSRGVYTFKVQGKIHHFLGSISPHDKSAHGLHLYFYDSDVEVKKRLEHCERFKESIMCRLLNVMAKNPYVMFLKQLQDLENLDDCNILLHTTPAVDQRLYNLPTSSEVAGIITPADDDMIEPDLHIQIYTKECTPYKISHTFACYDPLQYPLLFPQGESGWHRNIERIPSSRKSRSASRVSLNSRNNSVMSVHDLFCRENIVLEQGKKKTNSVTCREYYCYKFQIRRNDNCMLLRTGRLFQQFIVDMFAKIETSRLEFLKKNQKDIRTEFLQGVLDSIASGHKKGTTIGRKIILPPSFMGGPRDMRKRYLDAMCLVQRFGKPDFFLTMTCNPSWPEIENELSSGELPQNRPDLLARVFKSKFESLKDDILKEHIFGEVAAYAYSIEFQKRGLPHAHILLIMKKDSKPLNPEAYDRLISAELPCKHRFPLLHAQVVKHMAHGPCGSLKPNNPCMVKGKCKNKYPKDFIEQTTHGSDSYPHYRRRNSGITAYVRGHKLDNRWIVPYNPYLLNRYDCHLNVEICSTIKLVKYIYKYIYKGSDKIAFRVATSQSDNEIKEYQDGRWISPPEAAWRIFSFALFDMQPSVFSLQVHLPNNYSVSFAATTDLESVVLNPFFSQTMLTEFFKMNKYNEKAKHLNCLYKDFPSYFVWDASDRMWKERKRKNVIGRVVSVNPSEGDRYYLRLLLNNVKSPISYDDLLTVNGQLCNTFREATLQRGLLASDYDIEKALEEGSLYQMPIQFRHLFSTVLVYCEPKNPKRLWEKFESSLSEDYRKVQSITHLSDVQIRRKVLQDIANLLDSMGKRIHDYNLCPNLVFDVSDMLDTREISFEKNLSVSEIDLASVNKLNHGQQIAYNSIIENAFSNESGAFFIDGPGGTGKTFLYKAILATLRSQGYIALATATSGVAAALLPGGRTAHSRFKLPLHTEDSKIAKLSKQSSIAKLIRESKVIIWDEAPMAHRHAIESFEEMLRDITENTQPFGNKTIVFGGDFRQVLPVIRKGSRIETINSSLIASHLWPLLEKFQLTENMRALTDPFFVDFLLRIGNGTETHDSDDNVFLPENMLIPFSDRIESLHELIHCVYPDISAFIHSPLDVTNRALLAPINTCVDDINDIMIDMLPGTPVTYISTDVPVDPLYQTDYEDFLNSLNPSSLPPHELVLKLNSPVILLRNLHPTEGFCNGTRLLCKELNACTVRAEISSGAYIGKSIILNRIPLQSSDDETSGIPFKRYQLPIRLCFAMTINKAQGQTLDFVGIYLREPVFSHGQLYVALSRAKKSSDVKVLIVPPTFSDRIAVNCTRNVVFPEILNKCLYT